MTSPEEFQALGKAFSVRPHGVEEKSMLEILVKCKPADLATFRKKNPDIFLEDDRSFERWKHCHMIFLENEFVRFQKAVIQWTMHPWERDARLVRKSLDEEPPLYNLLIELACTRTSEEFLGTRKAFHSLYDESIEEFVACRVEGFERRWQLLVALVSPYRYEGTRVNDSIARSEATTLGIAIKTSDKKNLIEDDKIARMLTIRSKLHLKAVVKFYKEIYGHDIYEDLESVMSLKEIIQCLCHPQTYFTKVLIDAFKDDANDDMKEALTRVVVTRNNVDMKEIVEEFDKQYGVPLSKKIEEVALGNYKDFLVSLINRNSYHGELIN